MHASVIEKKCDSAIRFFLYLLIFWLPYSSAVVETCVIFGVILWLTKRSFRAFRLKKYVQSFSLPSSPINRPIAFFLAACLVSVLGSVFIEQSWHNFLTKTLEWFVVYFLILEVMVEKKHIFIAIGVLLFTALSTILSSIVQFHLTHTDIFTGRTFQPGDRTTAGFKTANGLGAYLTILTPLTFVLPFVKERLRTYRIFLLAFFFLTIWSLILTSSRGAWMGVILGFIFLLLVYYFHGNRNLLYGILALFIGTLILIAGLGLIVAHNAGTEPIMRLATVNWRMDIWRDSLVMFKDRWLFGHGINTFMQVFQSYRTGVNQQPTYTHNCYIQLAVETGIIGLMTFLWMILSLFHKSIKKINFFSTQDRLLMILSSGLLAGIFAFLVHSFVDTHFYSLQLSVYWWCMIGILVALMKSSEPREAAA